MSNHIPVLLQEVLEYLDPQPGEDVVDATVNGGGHAEAILERISPKGRLLGIDRDPSILEGTRKRLARFGDRVVLAEDSFSHMAEKCESAGVLHPSCILFDLGFSSYHLASANRGFSFQKDEPLDMRFNPKDTDLTAETLINHGTREELERIFKTYGEERNARRIAEAIADERKHRRFETTKDLALFLEKRIPRGRIHPATRIFQSLRIAVNDELGEVQKGIQAAFQVIAPAGRIAVITFHSLEDRLVKRAFIEAKAKGTILTKKPVTASAEEIRLNPRARSAKLRVFKTHEAGVLV